MNAMSTDKLIQANEKWAKTIMRAAANVDDRAAEALTMLAEAYKLSADDVRLEMARMRANDVLYVAWDVVKDCLRSVAEVVARLADRLGSGPMTRARIDAEAVRGRLGGPKRAFVILRDAGGWACWSAASYDRRSKRYKSMSTAFADCKLFMMTADDKQTMVAGPFEKAS